MLNENAKKWVAALRSGDFRQTKEHLERDGAYCCLGVACRLAIANGLPVEVIEEHNSVVAFDNHTGALPDSVRIWLGLQDEEGGYGRGTLTELNDEKSLTFAQIADIIESEPDGLFV